MLLFIYKLDSAPNEDAVCVLAKGEYVLGRGPLLKCEDKRASRTHALVKIIDDSATIMSTHKNPCFYQSANGKTMMILPKDSPVDIGDGDKFGIFPEQFWFRFKIKQETLGNGSLNTVINDNQHEIDIDKQNISNMSQVIDTKHETSQVNVAYQSAMSSSLKRHSEVDDEIDSKIPRIDNSEEHLKNELCLEELIQEEGFPTLEDVTNAGKNVKTGDVTENGIASTVTNVENGDIEEEKAIKKENDSDSREENLTSDADQYKEGSDMKREEVSGSESENDGGIRENVTSNPDMLDTNEKSDQQKERNTGNASSDRTADSENDINQKTVHPDVPSSSAAPSKNDNNNDKMVRGNCWYGANCYRKNPAHRIDYSHPGDADYDSNSNDNRPTCSYGATCYRRNKDHRREYRHPGDGKIPSDQKRKTRKTKANTGTKTPGQYKDSSEDDYDFDDPFIDDASEDEYQEESWSEDDSDEEEKNSQNVSDDEDTKALLKDAKRFTKNKM